MYQLGRKQYFRQWCDITVSLSLPLRFDALLEVSLALGISHCMNIKKCPALSSVCVIPDT